MLVVSLSEFVANDEYKAMPCRIMDNGVEIGRFIPVKHGFFSRLFCKKNDTVDGIRRPTRQLKAALRESKHMEKHPEKYKRYTDLDEMWADLKK